MAEEQSSNLQELLQNVRNNNEHKAKRSDKELFKLLQIGRKQGFHNFINRKQIWPFLLQLDSKKLRETPVFQWKGSMDRNSLDFQQLQKDADRSLSSMKTFQSITKFHLKKKQQAVLAVLDSFFAKNTDLKYIQGFHDVASIFLILFGNSTGYYLMERAGRTYFCDFLTFEFGQIGQTVSQIVFQMLTTVDPEFKTIYSSYEQTKFLIFILPWILTWFSHNFSSTKTTCRIWDYLLCTGPHGIFYLTSGIILSTKQQLLANCDQLDQPSIQTFYQQQAKKESIDIEAAIRVAMELQDKIQITELDGYKRLNPKSMIRLQNFSKQISFHKKFQDHHRKSEKMRNNIKLAAKVIGVGLLMIAAFYLLESQSKMKQMGEMGQF